MTDAEKSLTIDVVNELNGCCPPCRSPEPELIFDTGMAKGTTFYQQRYVLRCRHQGVCRHRYDFMEQR